jgi:hypothetical protein
VSDRAAGELEARSQGNLPLENLERARAQLDGHVFARLRLMLIPHHHASFVDFDDIAQSSCGLS